MDGNFTVEADRDAVLPVTQLIAERFAEYAASGADAWDATLDVHGRPKWLKDLSEACPHGSAESPRSTRSRRGRRAAAPFRRASAAVFVNGIQVAVGGDQQKPLLLSTSPVSMIG